MPPITGDGLAPTGSPGGPDQLAPSWSSVVDTLAPAAEAGTLSGGELDDLADAAHLVGRNDLHHRARERAIDTHLEEGNPRRAARSAFWLGTVLAQGGEPARANGWLSRAARLLADQPEAVEHGYLLLPRGLMALGSRDADTALECFGRAVALADNRAHDRAHDRADDPAGDRTTLDRAIVDLATLGRLGLGQAWLLRGEVDDGVALLDEAMLAVTAGEVGPLVTGIVYCATIACCRDIADVARAREWTAALASWCADHPDMVPFRGQCLVHRSEILQHQGDWPAAVSAAHEACVHLAGPPPQPAVGDAHHQQAELDRLRGRDDEAEEGYQRASQHGRAVQPGLALLRLAQGQPEAAAGSLRRSLEEVDGPVLRVPLLAASAEVALARDRVAEARTFADELDATAGRVGTPVASAVAAGVRGVVLLADDDAASALGWLRRAWAYWHEVDDPFEEARVRVGIGQACRALGDEDGCRLELDAARQVMEALGATTELARIERLATTSAAEHPGGLSDREVEVLQLVAGGASNKAIAAELVISEHTVARHLQNIYTKLGVDSRTAAAAFGYQHGLV